MSSEVKIKASFDRSLISEGGDSIRYLLVELRAPNDSNDQEPRASLNLAIVLDASASMGGKRIAAAIEAAEGIIEGLDENDFVSIVSFSEDAIVHIDGVNCDESGKRSALNAVKGIKTRSGTNLAEGWFKGSECVGTVMQEFPNCKNHVLILSDGHANQGTLEPTALSHHATELQNRGVSASAVGIGAGYSTAQLYAIAQYGGGRIHHAAHPPEIVEVVVGELIDLRKRNIENLKVTITMPEDISHKSLNLIPVEQVTEGVQCIFGGLSAGASRSAIFRIATPEGKTDTEVGFRIMAQWRKSGQKEEQSGRSSIASLRYIDAERNSFQPVADETAIQIARLWQSWVVWQATNLNRMRDYVKLERLLVREIKFFKRFCKICPQAAAYLVELEGLFRIANEDWDEASRKEIQSSTYTTIYGISDPRKKQRKWQDYTGEFRIN